MQGRLDEFTDVRRRSQNAFFSGFSAMIARPRSWVFARVGVAARRFLPQV
jgi:hypothetical protein